MRPGKARHGQAGFTLLELLVIMAILGIIAGIFGLFLIRALRQNELRDAAYQLISDLRRARSGAQKTGVDNVVEIVPNTSGYSLKVGDGAASARTLPNRVRINPVGATTLLTYRPPFGTLSANGISWKLTSPADPNLNLWVKAIGITGKVMLSASEE